MIERYANGAVTTLDEDLDTSETGVDVVSVTGFPAAGNFRILIGRELMIVTAVSGTTFTVIRGAEGTAAAVHTAGDVVTHVLTRDAMPALFSTIWGTGFRQKLSLDDWTWVNQGTATVNADWGLSLYAPPVWGDQIRILTRAAPATPYTITACLNLMIPGQNPSAAGIGFRESSSGKLALLGLTYVWDFQYRKFKMDSPSSYNDNYRSMVPAGPVNPIVFRLVDDGMNRGSYISPDGRHFWLFHSVGRTDYLTADEVCFWANTAQENFPVIADLLSWEVA